MKHKFSLSKDDFNTLDDLVKITNAIKNLYDNLIKLEKENKKDSQEYKKTLDYLHLSREVENKIYDEKFNDITVCHKFLKYLNKFRIDFNQSLTNEIMSHTNIVLKRIYKKIFLLANRYTDIENDFFNDDIKTFALSWHTDLKQKMLSDYYDNYYLPNLFSNEIRTEVYRRLDVKSSKVLSDQNLKERMIDFKYNLVFLNPYLEDNLMETQFFSLIPFNMDYENKTVFKVSEFNRQDYLYEISLDSLDDLTDKCKDNNQERLMLDECILTSCADFYDNNTFNDISRYCESLRSENKISSEKEKVLVRSGILAAK